MSEISSTISTLLLTTGAWMYNRLVGSRNLANEAWAGIDVQLRKRSELVPNLAQTFKGYETHESSVFEAVTRARNINEPRDNPRSG